MSGGKQKTMSVFGKDSKEISSKTSFLKRVNIKKIFKKKSAKVTGILIIILIVAGSILITRTVKARDAMKNLANSIRTYTVRRGNIETTVTGAGPITSSSREEITSKIEGKVEAVYFKEGDKVKAGDLLVKLDDTDIRSDVGQIQSNVMQEKINYDNALKKYSDLTITAPFDGFITSMSAGVGDDKKTDDEILTLVDTSKLKATLTFTGIGIADIKAGKTATVYSHDFMDSFNGTVTYVSNRPYSTSSGGALYKVEIEINNPGALQEGMNVNADIKTSAGTVSSTDSAQLDYVNKKTIKTSTGGTVASVNARENSHVNKGDLLVELENADAEQNEMLTSTKLRDYEDQLKAAEEKLSYCTVTAPFDGMIVSQDIKAGQTVNAGASLVTIIDQNAMEFAVPVDELDISKVKLGQKADISVDALTGTSEKPLSGTVTKIATEGTSSNGVTDYDVTIKLDEINENIKGGMNASAKIYITKKTDVLCVPLEAVHKIGDKNYVMVQGDAQTVEEMKSKGTYIDLFNETKPSANSKDSKYANNASGGNAQGSAQKKVSIPSSLTKNKEYYLKANVIPTLVEIGDTTASNVEITSGLKEGDKVVLPPVSASSSSSTSTTNRQNNQVGVPGGGMPAGGMQIRTRQN